MRRSRFRVALAGVFAGALVAVFLGAAPAVAHPSHPAHPSTHGHHHQLKHPNRAVPHKLATGARAADTATAQSVHVKTVETGVKLDTATTNGEQSTSGNGLGGLLTSLLGNTVPTLLTTTVPGVVGSTVQTVTGLVGATTGLVTDVLAGAKPAPSSPPPSTTTPPTRPSAAAATSPSVAHRATSTARAQAPASTQPVHVAPLDVPGPLARSTGSTTSHPTSAHPSTQPSVHALQPLSMMTAPGLWLLVAAVIVFGFAVFGVVVGAGYRGRRAR